MGLTTVAINVQHIVLDHDRACVREKPNRKFDWANRAIFSDLSPPHLRVAKTLEWARGMHSNVIVICGIEALCVHS
jgi:hypothetical protein